MRFLASLALVGLMVACSPKQETLTTGVKTAQKPTLQAVISTPRSEFLDLQDARGLTLLSKAINPKLEITERVAHLYVKDFALETDHFKRADKLKSIEHMVSEQVMRMSGKRYFSVPSGGISGYDPNIRSFVVEPQPRVEFWTLDILSPAAYANSLNNIPIIRFVEGTELKAIPIEDEKLARKIETKRVDGSLRTLLLGYVSELEPPPYPHSIGVIHIELIGFEIRDKKGGAVLLEYRRP